MPAATWSKFERFLADESISPLSTAGSMAFFNPTVASFVISLPSFFFIVGQT
jgi:hypothetical protein